MIGGAAASLSAAIYARRAGLDVLVVTDEYGGQINNTDVVENYLGIKSISGPDLAEQYVEHMRDYDIDEAVGYPVEDIRKSDGVFEVETAEEVYEARSVIIGTGGSRRKLDVKGEEEYRNKGVAYCAVCDGPLYQGEDVVVVGGGYSGTEAAVYLSDVAENVYVLNRSAELSGEKITIDKVYDADNVEVFHNATIEEIGGDQLVDHVKFDQSGEERELEVTGVFVEIGTVPNSDITDLVETDDSGYIKVNNELETGVEGLYAAGDVNNLGPQQLAVSAGQGCQAGLNAADYVKEKKD